MKSKIIKNINLIKKITFLLKQKKLVKTNQKILLAISGGQDSVCLFFILFQLKNQWNWFLGIIYCNHLWQKDSFYSFWHNLKISYLFNLPMYLFVPSTKILTEEKARTWRYYRFQRITLFYNYEIIITAHTGSDRIETLFSNLMRGSGTEGLFSLKWVRYVNEENLKIIFPHLMIFLKTGLSFKKDKPFIETNFNLKKSSSSKWKKTQIKKKLNLFVLDIPKSSIFTNNILKAKKYSNCDKINLIFSKSNIEFKNYHYTGIQFKYKKYFFLNLKEL
uniref:tRNA(Ile)-lysidine synthetase n=1 Tax=Pleurastrosarcina brevispinosa TaxID=163096 RepID=A0A097KN81_9CHLO|nr:hypothetical chloroplast RF62 [Chlorosarcina brevispinosa]